MAKPVQWILSLCTCTKRSLSKSEENYEGEYYEMKEQYTSIINIQSKDNVKQEFLDCKEASKSFQNEIYQQSSQFEGDKTVKIQPDDCVEEEESTKTGSNDALKENIITDNHISEVEKESFAIVENIKEQNALAKNVKIISPSKIYEDFSNAKETEDNVCEIELDTDAENNDMCKVNYVVDDAQVPQSEEECHGEMSNSLLLLKSELPEKPQERELEVADVPGNSEPKMQKFQDDDQITQSIPLSQEGDENFGILEDCDYWSNITEMGEDVPKVDARVVTKHSNVAETSHDIEELQIQQTEVQSQGELLSSTIIIQTKVFNKSDDSICEKHEEGLMSKDIPEDWPDDTSSDVMKESSKSQKAYHSVCHTKTDSEGVDNEDLKANFEEQPQEPQYPDKSYGEMLRAILLQRTKKYFLRDDLSFSRTLDEGSKSLVTDEIIPCPEVNTIDATREGTKLQAVIERESQATKNATTSYEEMKRKMALMKTLRSISPDKSLNALDILVAKGDIETQISPFELARSMDGRSVIVNPDLILKVNGQEFHVHQEIMRKSCDYFEQRLTRKRNVQCALNMDAEYIDSEAFNVVLNVLYDNEPDVPCHMMPQIIRTSVYLDVEPAINFCLGKLNSSDTNIIKFLNQFATAETWWTQMDEALFYQLDGIQVGDIEMKNNSLCFTIDQLNQLNDENVIKTKKQCTSYMIQNEDFEHLALRPKIVVLDDKNLTLWNIDASTHNFRKTIYLDAKEWKSRLEKESQQALKVLTQNFETVITRNEYLHLDKWKIEKFLSADAIKARSEIVVFLAALKWIQKDLYVRKKFAEDVLKCVRFSQMSLEDLLACYNPPVLRGVMQQLEVKDILDKALSCISTKADKKDEIVQDPSLKPRILLIEGKPIKLWDI